MRRRVSALHLLRALANVGALVDLSGPLANQVEARRGAGEQDVLVVLPSTEASGASHR